MYAGNNPAAEDYRNLCREVLAREAAVVQTTAAPDASDASDASVLDVAPLQESA
jgi:hypothetical protein